MSSNKKSTPRPKLPNCHHDYKLIGYSRYALPDSYKLFKFVMEERCLKCGATVHNIHTATDEELTAFLQSIMP